jgi:hypothetical protein
VCRERVYVCLPACCVRARVVQAHACCVEGVRGAQHAAAAHGEAKPQGLTVQVRGLDGLCGVCCAEATLAAPDWHLLTACCLLQGDAVEAVAEESRKPHQPGSSSRAVTQAASQGGEGFEAPA